MVNSIKDYSGLEICKGDLLMHKDGLRGEVLYDDCQGFYVPDSMMYDSGGDVYINKHSEDFAVIFRVGWKYPEPLPERKEVFSDEKIQFVREYREGDKRTNIFIDPIGTLTFKAGTWVNDSD